MNRKTFNLHYLTWYMTHYFKKSKKLNPVRYNNPFLPSGTNNLMNLNWEQTHKLFPEILPGGDLDADGIVNSKDCKPFDPLRHGFFQRAVGVITGGRRGQSAEEYSEERKAKKQAVQQRRISHAAPVIPVERFKTATRGGTEEKKEYRKQLFKIREKQMQEKAKLEARVVSGEVSKQELKEMAQAQQKKALERPINVYGSKAVGYLSQIRTSPLKTGRGLKQSPLKYGKGEMQELKAQIQLEKLRQKAAGVRGRGRPVGSYAPEYQQFGGVYNARKVVAQQRALERAEAMRQATISPEQQQIINQFEAQRRARMGTPFGWESVSVSNDIKKEVSSTSLGSLQDEIERATHAVD